ncbi:MAG: Ig-like domain repeat protein [Bryobacteraceae bacterium]
MRTSRQIQSRGLRFRRGILARLGWIVFAGSAVLSAQDTTPPVLVTYSFAPAAFDVSFADTALTGAIQATDNSSGLQSAFLAFYSPSGNRRVDCHSSAGSYSGTLTSGTFTCRGVFPRYSETGQWRLQFLTITDRAGNAATYTRDQLAAMGFPTVLTLTGASDTLAPLLVSYSFSPSSITLTGSSVTLTGTITATDNLSGLYLAYIAFYSPSGQQRVDCYPQPGAPNSGTPLNGSYNCSGTFTPGMETGTWRVQFVELRDVVGNARYYTTQELAGMGLPTTLPVSAPSDTTAPVLSGLSLSPLSVNTSSGAAGISGTITASDAGSGLRRAAAALFSPTGQQRVDCVTAVLPAGTAAAAMPCNGTFPQNSESGAWEVRFVEVSDHAGNTATVLKASLAQMGAPVTVMVTGASSSQPPAGLVFQYVTGGAVPSGQAVQFYGSTIPWILEKETGAAWVQLSATTGAAPGQVVVTVNPAGMPYGTHLETLLVREVIQNRVVARVPVKLTVLAAAPLTARYFDPPLFEVMIGDERGAGEPVGAFVYVYWPAPP